MQNETGFSLEVIKVRMGVFQKGRANEKEKEESRKLL